MTEADNLWWMPLEKKIQVHAIENVRDKSDED